MLVSEALKNRKATRAFLPKAVDKEIIERILLQAGHAPSGVNSQPWQVAVVTSATKQRLQEQMESTFRNGEKGKMEYQYYPLQ